MKPNGGDLAQSDEWVRLLLVVSADHVDADVAACARKLTEGYIWEREPLVFKAQTDTPCPWFRHGIVGIEPRRIFWSYQLHDGSTDDEWFLAYVASTLTTTFRGSVAQVQCSDGEFLLIEAAEYLPRWLDSSRLGGVDEIARHRAWIHGGTLHIIPPRSPALSGLEPGALEPHRALEAITHPGVSTRAPLRVQEHLLRARFAKYPEAARAALHVARVRLPLPAAASLLGRPWLAAAAARALLARTPEDMTRAVQCRALWPASARRRAAASEDDQVACTLLMRRSHFAALRHEQLSAPRGWPLPADGSPAAKHAALGVKLAVGLQVLADTLGVDTAVSEASLTASRAEADGAGRDRPEAGGVASSDAAESGSLAADGVPWQRCLHRLQDLGYFSGSAAACEAERRRLTLAAQRAFAETPAADRGRGRGTGVDPEVLRTALRTPADRASIEESAREAEDTDDWIDAALPQRLAEYSQEQMSASPAPVATPSTATGLSGCDEASAQGAAAPRGVGQAQAGGRAESREAHEEPLEAAELAGALQRFVEGAAGLGGADPRAAAAISADGGRIAELLRGVLLEGATASGSGGSEGSDAGVEGCGGASDAEWSGSDDTGASSAGSSSPGGSVPGAAVDGAPGRNGRVLARERAEGAGPSCPAAGDHAGQARGGCESAAACIESSTSGDPAAPTGGQGGASAAAEARRRAGGRGRAREAAGSGEAFLDEYMAELDTQLREGSAGGEMDRPVHVDAAAVENLLRSVGAGGGAPSAAGGLLGMLGIGVPPGTDAEHEAPVQSK